MSKRYLLDANVFIEAKNRYYGFDLCPGFWVSMIRRHDEKRVVSIDRIENELKEQDDDVKKWIKESAPDTFFKKTADQDVIDMFQKMVTWVYGQSQFTAEAKSEFASVADGWVVAFAAVNDLIVVTHEQYAAETKKKVPIPNVCLEFNVVWTDTFAMLRELGEKYIRSTKSDRTRGKRRRR